MTTFSDSERGEPVDLYNYSMECKSVNTYNIRHPFKLDNTDSDKKKTPFVYNEGDSTDGKTFILKHAHRDFGKVDLSSLVTYERCHRLNYYYKAETEDEPACNEDAKVNKVNEDDSAVYEDRLRKVDDEKVMKQLSSRSNNDKCVQTSFDKEGDDGDVMERNCTDECKRSDNYLFPQQINTLSNNNCFTEENNKHNGIDSESGGIENENHDTINNMLASNENENDGEMGYDDNRKDEGYVNTNENDNDNEGHVNCNSSSNNNNNDKQNAIKAMEITFNTNNKIRSNNNNNNVNQLQQQQHPYQKPPLVKVKNISNIDLTNTNNNNNNNAFIDDLEPFANNHNPSSQPSKLQNLKNHLQQLNLSGNEANNNNNNNSPITNNMSNNSDNNQSQKQFRSLLEQFKQNLTKDTHPINNNNNPHYNMDLYSNFKQHHSPSSPLLKPYSLQNTNNINKPPTKSNFDNIKLFSETTTNNNNAHRPSSNLTEFSIYNPNDNNPSSNYNISSPRRQPLEDAEINGVKAPSNVRDLKDMFYYNLEANRSKTSLAELNSMIIGSNTKPQMNITSTAYNNNNNSIQHRMSSPLRINNTFYCDNNYNNRNYHHYQPLVCKKYNWYIVDSIIYPSNNMHETALRIDNKLLYN